MEPGRFIELHRFQFGQKFSREARNSPGQATGLSQFMPTTAEALEFT